MNVFWKKALPYIITSAVGIAMFIGVICIQKIWDAEGTANVMRLLSDACLVPGVLLAGFGLIIFASNGGAFDMLTYAVIKLFDLFKRDPRNKKYKDFYEYREAQKGKKRKMAFMLIVGSVFILFSVIFLVVYYVTLPPAPAEGFLA